MSIKYFSRCQYDFNHVIAGIKKGNVIEVVTSTGNGTMIVCDKCLELLKTKSYFVKEVNVPLNIKEKHYFIEAKKFAITT